MPYHAHGVFCIIFHMTETIIKIIRLPKLLTIGWSHILFASCADAISHKGPITFDFEKVEWAAPFGLTTISVTLAKCLNQGKLVYYSPPKHTELNSYLERIGFKYHFLSGKAIEHKKTSLELKRLLWVDPGCSAAIVELVAHDFPLSEDAKYEMRTHINELMTNGFDHSKSNVGCYVCAQWYPVTKKLRISFADGGIGVLQSLKDSGDFPSIHTDAAAIRLAVKPGVTTRREHRGGFGLDYIRRYARNNNGTLSIISGHAKVNFYINKIEEKYETISFPGTVVDITISPKDAHEASRSTKDDLF